MRLARARGALKPPELKVLLQGFERLARARGALKPGISVVSFMCSSQRLARARGALKPL